MTVPLDYKITHWGRRGRAGRWGCARATPLRHVPASVLPSQFVWALLWICRSTADEVTVLFPNNTNWCGSSGTRAPVPAAGPARPRHTHVQINKVLIITQYKTLSTQRARFLPFSTHLAKSLDHSLTLTLKQVSYSYSYIINCFASLYFFFFVLFLFNLWKVEWRMTMIRAWKNAHDEATAALSTVPWRYQVSFQCIYTWRTQPTPPPCADHTQSPRSFTSHVNFQIFQPICLGKFWDVK